MKSKGGVSTSRSRPLSGSDELSAAREGWPTTLRYAFLLMVVKLPPPVLLMFSAITLASRWSG